MPEHVNVVMAEVAADMREGLLALAVGAALQVMTALMDSDVTAWRTEGQAQRRPGRGAARDRPRVGHPRRPTGAGAPPAGACGGRLGRAASADL